MSNNNPKPDFTATFSLGTFTVNVPSDVHNADVNPSENNVIKTNGTYNVPNNKSGWNSFSVNVTPTITPNVADLMITNDVYDYVKEHHDGMLILPGNDPTIIEETMFDTHGKDYATSVIIDLNFLDKELKIDPAHQKLRLSEDEEDFEIYDYEKDGDYDVRVKPKPEPEPEQEPEPTKNKSRYITFKSNTRDIIEDDPTYRNIGSFTIVAPILNSIVLPVGTYTFNIGIYNNENNTDYLGVKTITFTPNPPNVQPKTITIDTIGNNQSTTYNASNDNVDGYSSVTIINNTSSAVPLEDKNIEYNLGVNIPNTITPSSGYYGINNVTFSPITSGNVCTNLFQGVTLNDIQPRINTELGLTGSLTTVVYNDYYFTINVSGVTNETLYSIVTGKGSEVKSKPTIVTYLWCNYPFIANHFSVRTRGSQTLLDVSNDALNWIRVKTLPGQTFSTVDYEYNVPEISASWKFYRFTTSGDWIYIQKFISEFCKDASYNNTNINLENNKQLTLTNNDINSTVYLNPSTGYNGFSNAIITVPNIHPNPTLYTQSTITINGTYNLPTGYDGFAGPITVNVQPTINYVKKWRMVLTYKNGNYVSTTSEEGYTSYMNNYTNNHSINLSQGTDSRKYFAIWANENSFGFYIWNSNGSVGGGGSTSVNIPPGHYDSDYFSNASSYPFETTSYSCVFQSITLYLLDSNNNTLWTYTDTVPENTYVPHLFSGTTTIDRENVKISFT